MDSIFPDFLILHKKTLKLSLAFVVFLLVSLHTFSQSSCLPTITISTSSTNICYNLPLTFTSVVINPGVNPVYQWKKNGTPVGTNSPTFSTSALMNTDVITCEVTSNAPCAAAYPTALSNRIVLTANEISPKVTIASSADTVCSGSSVTFTATNKNGNPGAVFLWTADGKEVGTNSNVYTANNLTSSASIQCKMTVPHCTTGTTKDISDPIKITVAPASNPGVLITTASNNLCKGSTAVFTASAIAAGKNPVFRWKINGNATGSNGNTLTSISLSDGDVVTCMVEVDAAEKCVTMYSAVSNSITMKITEVLVPSISITASNAIVCQGSNVTFSAVAANAGASSSVTWQLNGKDVSSNNTNYSSATLANGDKVNCLLIVNNAACGATSLVSDVVTMTVNPLPKITITPIDTIVNVGSEVKLNATATGNVVSYVWTPANELSGSQTPGPTTKPIFKTTTYQLRVTSADGCMASQEVTVKPFSKLFIPTAFSPNGDGRNDLFRVPPSVGLALEDLSVYGRWGEMIFHTSDITKGWDGTYKGNPLEIGSYVYVIKGSTSTEKVNLKGTVVLVR